MSYQRAVMNCRRCYELASTSVNKSEKLLGLTFDELERLAAYQKGLNAWQARNEAMKALEQAEKDIVIAPEGGKAYIVKKIDVLDACMNCTYKRPAIIDAFWQGNSEVKENE